MRQTPPSEGSDCFIASIMADKLLVNALSRNESRLPLLTTRQSSRSR